MTRRFCCALLAATLLPPHGMIAAAGDLSREEAVTAMRKAVAFFRSKVAVHGGYVYGCSLDLSRRWGEGVATAEQIWVQRPGTPAVGMACLKAHEATGEPLFLEAAREAAEALVFGQLESGGWTHSIDFAPASQSTGRYRDGKGREKGKNQSSLDDGVTQHALRLLMHADKALEFKHAQIHEASAFARAALLKAQFVNGGFPQGWKAPAEKWPAVKAQYPDYEWRTENRIKEYWGHATLNDGLAGDLTQTLTEAWDIYKDEGCRHALGKLGDFLILAQMPEPQPGWAQQYDGEMRPAWARKFEPPALAGSESQDAIAALLSIHRFTEDPRYLEPIPRALAWLNRSLLPDGRLARFYELRTNKPLYMTQDYTLTYDDSGVPSHYGWKGKSRVAELEAAMQAVKAGKPVNPPGRPEPGSIRAILAALDAEGRWVSIAGDSGIPAHSGLKPGDKFLSSAVFVRNLETLAAYVKP